MTEKNQKKGKVVRVYLPLAIVIAVVLGIGWYYYKEYTHYIKTDDAYVDADKVAVSAKMMGRIEKMYVDEGDTVQKGKLLAELDSTDLLAQKVQAEAAVEQAQTALVQAQAQYEYYKENLKVLKVNLSKSKDDLDRGKTQFNGGVITQEKYEHLQKAFEASSATYQAALKQLQVVQSQIKSAKAAINTAKSQVGVIEASLDNTKLYAPISGVIAKRWLLQGDMAQPGQSVVTISNHHDYWITVYLEETNVGEIKNGQQAKFTIDAYPGVTFSGRIFYIGSNAASQFALIPPDNASGNFTKVTQRVPVKISIDKADNNEEISQFNLMAGMSSVIKIIRQ
ncbi:HlyD family secretion protein [Prolixibacter sp. SD074]|jgi:membrane fusion protein (multidrug efflux system)|uniref:HlyD family secretion protein n=1 Tax=Prolixibacter sp. SD074 TaxID=2652391 RepID=UPI00127CB60B|nr:HlyD family secretion protein [Prolixibacter sp. SD074]GET28580.1 RND transporter [Prolixibacter sp. SD074]